MTTHHADSTGVIRPVPAPLATQAEMDAGTSLDERAYTPADIKRAITTNAPSIASQAEAEAGSNNTKMMTPLRVAQEITALLGIDYYEYEAFVAQSGTANPTVTTLKNATGYTVTWTRSSAGDCRMTLSGTPGYSNGARKTLYVSNAGNSVDMDPKAVLALGKWSDTEFRLACYRESAGALTLTDGFWAHVYMRIYYGQVPGG